MAQVFSVQLESYDGIVTTKEVNRFFELYEKKMPVHRGDERGNLLFGQDTRGR